MKNLKELLKETEFTNEEWQIHQKVEKRCQLEDLQYSLDEMLECELLTQEQYDKACNNADWIIEKYNKWLEYDWGNTMREAINCIVEDE